MSPHVGPMDALSVIWDPQAGRRARVLVSDGLLEIVLDDTDHAWVEDALTTIAHKQPTIVVACPENHPPRIM